MKETQTIEKKETSYKTDRISGSEAIIRCLLEENVDILYGYPGGAIMPVYDELYKYQDKIHHVLTRHDKVRHMQLRVLLEFQVELVFVWQHQDQEQLI